MWLGLGLLAIAAALLYRARLRRYEQHGSLSDEHIRMIEARGSVEVDEPLDLPAIRAEEERFLEEASWDEPDEP